MSAGSTKFYRWHDGGVIRSVEVREQSNGHAVAYLEADYSEQARETRQHIRAMLRAQGWGTLSDHRNGKFFLRISGLRNGDELLGMLQKTGFLHTSPEICTIEAKQEAPKGLWGYIKAHSLTISGIIATIGNLMGIAQGIHRSMGQKLSAGQIGKGTFFMLGDLPLALAGERDDARQLNNLLRHLKHHYDKEGFLIPGTSSILAETSDKGKGRIELAKDYLHRYANQVKCVLEVAAAFSSFFAGREQKSTYKQYAPIFWGGGFAAALLIPERKIDEEKYAQAGMFKRLWMRLQSNPLTIAGLLGYTNNIGDYLSAYSERKKWIANGKTGSPFYLWDVATPTVMLGANGTYAISRKTVGGDIQTEAIVSDVYTIAAQILNKQPENMRAAAMESTAKFLGERPEIKDSHVEILTRLRQEMDIQHKSPWFEPHGVVSYAPMAGTTPAPKSTLPATTISGQKLDHKTMGTAQQLSQSA